MTILNETIQTLLNGGTTSDDIRDVLTAIDNRTARIAELTAQRDSITAELDTLTGTQHTTAVEDIAHLDSTIDMARTELARLVSISSGRARGMTIGIEIEFYAPSNINTFRDCLASHLVGTSVAINYSTGGYHNNTSTKWQLANDSSVDGMPNGMELISPILKGERGLQDAIVAMDALNACGATVDKQCGVHVHFGVERMSWTSVKRIIETYTLNQDLINATLPRSRRNNFYSRDLPLTSRNSNGRDDYGINLDRISDFDNDLSTQDVVGFLGGRSSYHNSRYFAVNLIGAYTRHKTIEFRALAGTVESEKLEMWVRFLHLIVKSAETTRDTNRAYDSITTMCNVLSDKTDLTLRHATENPTSDWARMVQAVKTGTDINTGQSAYRSRANNQLAGNAIGEWLQQRAYDING